MYPKHTQPKKKELKKKRSSTVYEVSTKAPGELRIIIKVHNKLKTPLIINFNT